MWKWLGNCRKMILNGKVMTILTIFVWKGLLFHSREMGLCSRFPVKNVIEFSRRYMRHSFFRATVHMWKQDKSNEQAFKIWSLPLKDQWLNWLFNFTWLIAKFVFWKIKGGYAFLFFFKFGPRLAFLYLIFCIDSKVTHNEGHFAHKNYIIDIDFKIYKFKYENLNDRANLSTYYRTLSAQTIQRKKKHSSKLYEE